MQDEPKPDELIKAVADFLRRDVVPQLSGHAAFKLRVGINALDLVVRQLTMTQASDDDERARLSQLLGAGGDFKAMNAALADGIASGAIDLDDPNVIDHLWRTTMEKLAVDQPNYASYRQERARDE